MVQLIAELSTSMGLRIFFAVVFLLMFGHMTYVSWLRGLHVAALIAAMGIPAQVTWLLIDNTAWLLACMSMLVIWYQSHYIAAMQEIILHMRDMHNTGYIGLTKEQAIELRDKINERLAQSESEA